MWVRQRYACDRWELEAESPSPLANTVGCCCNCDLWSEQGSAKFDIYLLLGHVEPIDMEGPYGWAHNEDERHLRLTHVDLSERYPSAPQ